MSSTYKGVPLDLPVPGYTDVPTNVLAASNLVNLIDKELANIDSISKNYTNAFNAYTKEAAFNITTDAHSKDAATYNAAIASNANMINLRLELAKWEDIVQKNGGSLALKAQPNGAYAADPEPNFTSVRSKLEKDKQAPNLVLKNAGPEICSGLPPFDKSYQVILADAVKKNEENTAPIVAQQNAQYAFVNDLKALTSPNQSALDKGYAERNSPEAKADLLNRGISSGALNGNWDLNTLGLAADLVPKGRSLSNTELNSIAKGIPKGASLEQVKLLLQRAAVSGPATRVIASSPVAKGPTSTKPTPKPAAVKTPPAKPTPKPAAVKTPPAKPAPKPAAPRAQLPKPKGK
jgi:cell division septation protein DedD